MALIKMSERDSRSVFQWHSTIRAITLPI